LSAYLCSACTIFLPKLACPAERKRRAEEAHQSATANGASAENGGSTVTLIFFAFSFCYICSVFVSLCGLRAGKTKYLSLLTLLCGTMFSCYNGYVIVFFCPFGRKEGMKWNVLEESF
jgi:hypothetical protein